VCFLLRAASCLGPECARCFWVVGAPFRYIGLIAKIESSDSLSRLHEIVAVSDGAMVARGDLGAQIPLEMVSLLHHLAHAFSHLPAPVPWQSPMLRKMQ